MKKILTLIKEYPDAAITIAAGIVVTILGLIGTEAKFLFASITAILSILAFSILRDRQAREELIKETQNLQRTLLAINSGKVSAENYFLTRAKLGSPAEYMKDAETLDMAGPSLLNISTTNQAILRDLKKSGAKIRLLISNPENVHLQGFLGLRHLETESGNAHANFVRISLSSLIPIVGEGITGGSLQVRITDQMQGFSYVGINTNRPSGKINVEVYLIKTALDHNPIISLNASTDHHWYEEFRSQFEYLWQNSFELDISKYK